MKCVDKVNKQENLYWIKENATLLDIVPNQEDNLDMPYYKKKIKIDDCSWSNIERKNGAKKE